jgi:TPR repeat protein
MPAMRKTATLLFCVALAAFAAPPAALADFARGKQAFDKKDYKLALAELNAEVKRGSLPAMHLLGVMYAEGKGVKRDDKRAFELFDKAAQGGHAGAQGMLAMFHAQGRATERNDGKSVEWARRAAENGDPLSQYMMGLRSMEGWGLPKSTQEAALWFGGAAEQNYALAQYSLGMLIGFNLVAGADSKASREYRIEGAKWLMLAIKQKSAELPDADRKLVELKKKMLDDEVREAEERARKWQPVAAKKTTS